MTLLSSFAWGLSLTMKNSLAHEYSSAGYKIRLFQGVIYLVSLE
jgi:hypothetical protein